MALGAPCEISDAADVPGFSASPEAHRYRLVVFLNCLYLTPERAAGDSEAGSRATDARWSGPADGIVTADAISTDAWPNSRAFRTKIYDRTWPLEN